MRKGRLGIVLLALVALLTLPSVTRAADDSACSFGAKFARLRAVQEDGTQDYITAIKTQLGLRKSILRGILGCALADVHAREDRLSNIPPDMRDPDLQKSILKGLQSAEDYYNTELAQIDDLGIKGTQDMARDIAAWRLYTYAPLAARQDSYELWMQNQPFFSKTEIRFAQIRPVVLSLAVLNHDEIQNAFKEAEDKFSEAKDANTKAKEALDNGDDNAPALVKSSLVPLADIYKSFMALSDRIKKIVP